MNKPKLGVLLVNLGTPTEPTAPAVREFLKAFLSDPKVVDLPRFLWLPILYGIILTFRPAKVAKNYAKIWFKDGSPLMVYSRKQQKCLQQQLNFNSSLDCKVELGMTYGEPSINGALASLEKWGAEKVVVLPLYPQYSTTTTACVTDQLEPIASQFNFELSVISDYHNADSYIEALARSVSPSLDESKKLVMSFHGIPKRYVKNGDPYQSHCEETARLLAEKLNLKPTQWEMAYQSRVGKEEWLRPYLDERMEEIAGEGTDSIAVMCPGFSVDCLETLEEIAMENKETFIENGGKAFEYIPALNTRETHIQMMLKLVLAKADL